MEKKSLVIIIASMALSLLFSCNKDLGNYDYHEVNEISFSGIDSVYNIVAGDILSIEPYIEATMKDPTTESTFSYEWAVITADGDGILREDKKVISTDRNLNTAVNLIPGPYFLYYTVTDIETGIFTRKRYRINATSDNYEGYLVLSDVDGKSRLDMLSYKSADGSMNQYSDILGKVGSALKLKGTPKKVYCYPYLSATYGIYILTSEHSDRIHPETFAYEIQYNLMYDFMVSTNKTIVGENMVGTPALIPGVSWLYADGNIYNSWRGFVNQLYGNPVNAYAKGGYFKVSPFMAVNQTSASPSAIIFNEDTKSFVKNVSRNTSSVEMVPASKADTLFDFNIGMDLVYMESNYTELVYAILHDKPTNKYYMARFTIGGSQSYWGEIMAMDFDKATHFAMSPELGYLFYTVGGKLYEYDLSLKQSKLMVDKGSSEITFINFNYFFRRSIASKASTYKIWANWLNVGSYDHSKSPDKAGTLEMYSVPPVNGNLVKEKSYDGFGKIVSISYRER